MRGFPRSSQAREFTRTMLNTQNGLYLWLQSYSYKRTQIRRRSQWGDTRCPLGGMLDFCSLSPRPPHSAGSQEHHPVLIARKLHWTLWSRDFTGDSLSHRHMIEVGLHPSPSMESLHGCQAAKSPPAPSSQNRSSWSSRGPALSGKPTGELPC